MGARVLQTLVSTETSKALGTFAFSTRSVEFPRGVRLPVSSACPRVFAPHLVGAGADLQDAYDAAHGVVVVSPHSSSELDADRLVSDEVAELTSAACGARSVSVCVASVRGDDGARVLDMLAAMALQGVARQARLSFVCGSDAERVMRDVARDVPDVAGAAGDTFLVTSVFWDGRLTRSATPILVLGSERDGVSLERFRGQVVDSVARTCAEMPVHAVFSRLSTDATALAAALAQPLGRNSGTNFVRQAFSGAASAPPTGEARLDFPDKFGMTPLHTAARLTAPRSPRDACTGLWTLLTALMVLFVAAELPVRFEGQHRGRCEGCAWAARAVATLYGLRAPIAPIAHWPASRKAWGG